MAELRRHHRTPIDVAVEFVATGANERVSGHAKDISLGGMFIVTTSQLAFSSQIVVHVTLPGQRAPFALPAIVRWANKDGMGVQFGLIGARETHAITQLAT